MMLPARPHLLLLAALLAFGGCAGGGGTTTAAPQASPTPTLTCPPGVATYVLVTDLMTFPPAGATGVATTVGVVTVPPADHVPGATVQLLQNTGAPIFGGTFGPNGAGGLTATIPQLQPNTTYHAYAVGVPCGPDFDFGQFTTGAS